MRCFIAVTVGERITGPVAEAARELRRAAERVGAGLKVAWTPPPGWHVTLKFLGQIERTQRAEQAGHAGHAGHAGDDKPADDTATGGHRKASVLDAITSAVEPVVSAQPAFDVRAVGVVTLPRASSPRVIAVGIRDDGSLARLAAGIDAALAPLGFEREKRRFTPHLTLGRIRRTGDDGWPAMRSALEAMRDLDLGTDSVREVDLFESELGPGGARYIRRAGFRLND